ncbi:MAG: exodeoxyribonuclease VII small subunit [Deltaproteobacteria bacterium]|nr:exodeoxyribonuclease VII small subunit [Deltaproteobacteria bacterium]
MKTQKPPASPGSNDGQDLPFEKSLEKLEGMVKKLESGELSLEDSVKAFEEGVQLAAHCGKKLDEAEKKVEILLQKDGALVKEPFNA